MILFQCKSNSYLVDFQLASIVLDFNVSDGLMSLQNQAVYVDVVENLDLMGNLKSSIALTASHRLIS